jgi:hypothetical protein
MTSNPPRSRRNNPYALDDLAAGLHHSTAGLLWRWRTESALTVLTAITTDWLAATLTLTTALIIIGATVTALFAIPGTRRWISRRAWCLITRHRIQRVCWETRMHTRSGRISLVAWIRPTDVGERAWILCRAGICAEDFEAHAGEIRAACAAREARITRNARWSQLVVIDIIRHDTLSAKRHVRPHILTRHAPATTPASTPVLAPVVIPAWPDSPATATAPAGQQS